MLKKVSAITQYTHFNLGVEVDFFFRGIIDIDRIEAKQTKLDTASENVELLPFYGTAFCRTSKHNLLTQKIIIIIHSLNFVEGVTSLLDFPTDALFFSFDCHIVWYACSTHTISV